MRTIFLILIIAVLLLIAAVATGLVNLRQTRPAVAPTVERNGGALTTRPGQAPAFDVETGSIGVGSSKTTVAVPSIQVRRPGGEQAPAQAAGAQPAPAPQDTQANSAQ
jgi:hypothetical protein